MHVDSDSEINDMQTRKEPILVKYVRRHHPADQIIGNKEAKPMKRSRLRSETFLLRKMEPKIVSEALQDDHWYNSMKEEIEKIEKNKTWTLVPRLADKNVIGTKWVFKNKLVLQRICTRRRSRQWRNIFSSCKNGRSKDSTSICSLQRIQSLSNGC